MNGKTPLYLTVLGVALAVGLLLSWQPYSVPSPWRRYTAAVRNYLRAAVQRDSMALVAQSITPEPVHWALHAARAQPYALAVWARYAQPSWGLRSGDTTIVGLFTSTDVCEDDPIVLRFLDQEGKARLVQATSACFDGQP